MTVPVPYLRATSFQAFQAYNPSQLPNGADMDAEFNRLKTTTDSLIAALAQIQRSDGALANLSVGPTQLTTAVSLGLAAPVPWTTGTAFAVGASCFINSKFYVCAKAHMSGVFAADLSIGDWFLAADFTRLPISSPFDYGVMGDGVTDDHAALNTFFAAAAANGPVAILPGNVFNIGSGTLVVPDGLTVFCSSRCVIRRTIEPTAGFGGFTPGIGSAVQMGNYARWYGAQFDNASTRGTSSTAQTIGTGAFTFTTQSGLGLGAGNSVRFYSASDPTKWMEGGVTSYSGTSLVTNMTASQGSGSVSDWKFNQADPYQCAMIFHGVTGSIVEGARLTGPWYEGIVFDGWNPSTGGSVIVSHCTARLCIAESVTNRAFYLYGMCADILFDGCRVLGNSVTNYGFNCNPANAVGTVNFILRCKIVNGYVESCSSQGYNISEQCQNCLLANCVAYNIYSSSGTGFLSSSGNAGANPISNTFVACVALTCTVGFQFINCTYTDIRASRASGCATAGLFFNSVAPGNQFCSVDGFSADGNPGVGIWVEANSNRLDLLNVRAIANTGTGIQIDSGASITNITGRSYSNGGSGNLLNNGTGTVSSGLVTT